MGSHPSEDTIEQLIAMGLASSRSEAISRLQANGNDLQRTVEAIFETPTNPLELQHQTNDVWDERPFQSDRTNDGGQDSAPANTGQPNHLQPHIFGAPSRPPSRVDGSRLIDLTAEHAAADPASSFNAAHDREDDDIRRAMELSMHDIGAQESGVTNTQEAHFGPARRDHYETNRWSLTRRSSTHDIILDPVPMERKLDREQPAFLKPTASAPYLAPLLTILHAIPLARQALLCSGHTMANYLHTDDWWSNGTNLADIGRASVGSVVGREMSDYNDIIFETQRLMAFLDATERSYGGIEGLIKLDLVREKDVDIVVGRFLGLWQDAVSRKTEDQELSEAFISLGVKIEAEIKHELARQTFTVLDVRLDDSDEGDSQTLYQAVDDIIWERPVLNDKTMAYLEHVGDIFMIRIGRFDGRGRPLPRNVEVPFIWYPDRYMKANLEMAQQIRRIRAETMQVLKDINKKVEVLSRASLPDGTSVDPKKLLSTSVNYLDKSSKSAVKNDSNHNVNGITSKLKKLHLARKLTAISDKIDAKIQQLEEQKQQAKEQLREMANLFTDQTDDVTAQPQHGFTLRGVSTEPHITYVLNPIKGEDVIMGGQTGDLERVQRYQWWRISYAPTDDPSKPVVTKMASKAVISSPCFSSSFPSSFPRCRPVPGNSKARAAGGCGGGKSGNNSNSSHNRGVSGGGRGRKSRTGRVRAQYSKRRRRTATTNNTSTTPTPTTENDGHSGGADNKHRQRPRDGDKEANCRVSKQKVSEDDVLLAAQQEGMGNVLLVYANRKAMDQIYMSELPTALKTFVQKDNATFARELQGQYHQEEAEQRQRYEGGVDHIHDGGELNTTEEMVEINRVGSQGEGNGIRRERASSEDSTEVQWGGVTPPSPPAPVGTQVVTVAETGEMKEMKEMEEKKPTDFGGGNGGNGGGESSNSTPPPWETTGFDGTGDKREGDHEGEQGSGEDGKENGGDGGEVNQGEERM